MSVGAQPGGLRRRLRNAWLNVQRMLRRASQPAPAAPGPKPPGPPRVDFSYTIFWTKQVRGWELSRQQAIRTALEAVLAQPEFEPNTYARRYRVPGLDDQAHAGASLLALRKVLAAFADTGAPTTKDEG